MIVFRTEVRDRMMVVDLQGVFKGDDAPSLLVDHLTRAACGGPLVVDLTGMTSVEGPAVLQFVRGLEAEPAHGTILLHKDIAARRLLRSLSRSLPVVPDVERARRGRFLQANPVVTVG